MYLKIQDATVRKNIEIFKIILKRESHSNLQIKKTSEEVKAFINRINGELRFAELNSGPIDSTDWIVVSFHFSLPEKLGDPVAFEVLGSENSLFSWDGFLPQALTVLKETVKTMQLMAKFLPYIQNLNATFRDFSQINLDSFLDQMPSKDLIHEVWRLVDRVGCERLFMNKPIGSFLFRQDEFAAILEAQLSKAYKKPMKCITLTYLDLTRRGVDFTFVKRKEGWVVYNDDPCLRGALYPTVKSVLNHFKAVLLVPLLNH